MKIIRKQSKKLPSDFNHANMSIVIQSGSCLPEFENDITDIEMYYNNNDGLIKASVEGKQISSCSIEVYKKIEEYVKSKLNSFLKYAFIQTNEYLDAHSIDSTGGAYIKLKYASVSMKLDGNTCNDEMDNFCKEFIETISKVKLLLAIISQRSER